MHKGGMTFSQKDDSEYDAGFLEALTRERSAIEEMEDTIAEDIRHTEFSVAPTTRKKLWRDTRKEALARLEDSARTETDFRNVVSWWDRLEANADRRYRYHVIGRSDIPLEWGASPEQIIVPEPIQHIFWKQISKGDFLDAIFDCPFEMHELVEDSIVAKAIFELKDVHKEVLYYSAIRQYSNQQIACIRSQTDRNILKVKNTILKKVRKKLYEFLSKKQEHSLTRKEKWFLKEYAPEFSEKKSDD
jgi:hypothetical protein